MQHVYFSEQDGVDRHIPLTPRLARYISKWRLFHWDNELLKDDIPSNPEISNMV